MMKIEAYNRVRIQTKCPSSCRKVPNTFSVIFFVFKNLTSDSVFSIKSSHFSYFNTNFEMAMVFAFLALTEC